MKIIAYGLRDILTSMNFEYPVEVIAAFDRCTRMLFFQKYLDYRIKWVTVVIPEKRCRVTPHTPVEQLIYMEEVDIFIPEYRDTVNNYFYKLQEQKKKLEQQ